MEHKLEDYEVCKTKSAKRRGLMFSKPKTLVFEFEEEIQVSLHMFFVFYSIDVLFLDKDKVIVEIKNNFRPFTFYTATVKSSYVVEMPHAMESNMMVGDKINL